MVAVLFLLAIIGRTDHSTTTTSSSDAGGSSAGATPTSHANPRPAKPVPTKKPVVKRPVSSFCRKGDPLANVYHPYRLVVLSRCVSVSGVVESVRSEDDGDTHIDIALDAKYRGLLNSGNRDYQHGWLVVEIVLADEPGCVVGKPPRRASGTYDYGICTGADLVAPYIGAHVWVTGPSVIDTVHGWAEIHPVWHFAPRP